MSEEAKESLDSVDAKDLRLRLVRIKRQMTRLKSERDEIKSVLAERKLARAGEANEVAPPVQPKFLTEGHF